MKNIFDTLTGSLQGSSVGEKLSNAMGTAHMSGMGEKISGALGGQGSLNTLGNLGGIGGLLGAGALGGLLGTLMSGKTAKTVAKGALVVGGTAAVGALAWNFYQKWSQNAAPAQQADQTIPPQSVPAPIPSGWSAQLTPPPAAAIALPPADSKALLLLQTMVFAARADGHIDASEQEHIHKAVSTMFPGRDMAALLDSLLDSPLDPSVLAAQVQNAEEAHDLYRLSCMIVSIDHFMERSYLDGLAAALHIPADLKAQLEQEVLQAKAVNA
ncbi:MAG: DUF533 domain-containing protein [Desulfovibrionaceae bacterium]